MPNNSPHLYGTGFYGKNLQFNEVARIFLFDHRETAGVPGGPQGPINIADRPFVHFNDAPDGGTTYHAIIHKSNPETLLEPEETNQIILHTTTQQAVDTEHLIDPTNEPRYVILRQKCKNSYLREKWLTQFLDLSFEDALEIAKANNRGALPLKIRENYAQLLDITHPGDPAAPLAFRLLCDAWHEVNVVGNSKLSEFPITAPTILSDWLAPFSPDGKDDAEKIASVVSKMGDTYTKDKAKKVLEAANGDRKTHVLSFLGIKEAATGQTEGGAQ